MTFFFTSSCGLNSLARLIRMPGIAEDFNQRGVLLINRGSASGVVCVPGSGEVETGDGAFVRCQEQVEKLHIWERES